MIPSIETIVEGLIAGEYTKQQAIGWLHQHAEGSANEERRMFAAMALQGLCGNPDAQVGQLGSEGRARSAVLEADALIAALARPSGEHQHGKDASR